jgi:hypothetical protein
MLAKSRSLGFEKSPHPALSRSTGRGGEGGVPGEGKERESTGRGERAGEYGERGGSGAARRTRGGWSRREQRGGCWSGRVLAAAEAFVGDGG